MTTAENTPTDRPKRRNTRPGTPPFLSDLRQERPGELIGGGFIVIRRGNRTGRLRVPEWPFEHPTLEAAMAECDRLSEAHPGEVFEVYRRVAASGGAA